MAKLTESMLRRIVKEEIRKKSLLKEASDTYSMVEEFLRLNAGRVVTIKQISDKTLLNAQEIIDALIEIQLQNDDWSAGSIDMDLDSVRVKIDPDFS